MSRGLLTERSVGVWGGTWAGRSVNGLLFSLLYLLLLIKVGGWGFHFLRRRVFLCTTARNAHCAPTVGIFILSPTLDPRTVLERPFLYLAGATQILSSSPVASPSAKCGVRCRCTCHSCMHSHTQPSIHHHPFSRGMHHRPPNNGVQPPRSTLVRPAEWIIAECRLGQGVCRRI